MLNQHPTFPNCLAIYFLFSKKRNFLRGSLTLIYRNQSVSFLLVFPPYPVKTTEISGYKNISAEFYRVRESSKITTGPIST